MATAAVLQLISSKNVFDNLMRVENFLKEACEQEIKVVVLPENFALMGACENDKIALAALFEQGLIQSHLSTCARRYDLWIIAGTIPIKTAGNRVRSACLVYDNKGGCVARYDKIHLFDVLINKDESYQESSNIEPGCDITVVDTPIGRVGLSICYDVRFPELYRRLVEKGAELLSIPSAFTETTGKAHWEILIRARAIENLCYVLAPNQGGKHDNGRTTHGKSMIVGPWGEILSQATEGIGMISAEIDLPQLRRIRQQFPTINHHVL